MVSVGLIDLAEPADQERTFHAVLAQQQCLLVGAGRLGQPAERPQEVGARRAR